MDEDYEKLEIYYNFVVTLEKFKRAILQDLLQNENIDVIENYKLYREAT